MIVPLNTSIYRRFSALTVRTGAYRRRLYVSLATNRLSVVFLDDGLIIGNTWHSTFVPGSHDKAFSSSWALCARARGRVRIALISVSRGSYRKISSIAANARYYKLHLFTKPNWPRPIHRDRNNLNYARNKRPNVSFVYWLRIYCMAIVNILLYSYSAHIFAQRNWICLVVNYYTLSVICIISIYDNPNFQQSEVFHRYTHIIRRI